jgi:RNA methyltransferase, TrmH family
MPESITSPSNKRIQWLHALHDAKGRADAGAFLVEGPHAVEGALDAQIRPVVIAYEPTQLSRSEAGLRVLGRIGALAATGVEVLITSPAAIERASDARSPQGVVMAIGREEVAPERVRARRRGRNRPLVLVLDRVSDPGNVGTLLRSALAADVDEVLLSAGCADPWAPKVLRAGVGAQFTVPLRTGLTWERIGQQLGKTPVVLADGEARETYDQLDLTTRTALIVSNEAHGASAEAQALATVRVRIPMWNRVESLNAAIAGSVILFEAARQRRAKQTTEEQG